jgi:hypothetical protein
VFLHDMAARSVKAMRAVGKKKRVQETEVSGNESAQRLFAGPAKRARQSGS